MAYGITIEGKVEKIGDDYESLRAFIGGYIESVTLTDRTTILYVDEEGRLKRLPPNPVASSLCGQPLFGPAVIVTPKRCAEDMDATPAETCPQCNGPVDEECWCKKCSAVTLAAINQYGVGYSVN